MRFRKSLAAVALAVGSLPASAAVLDFAGNICTAGACGDGSQILQTYGDVAGIVDVIYDSNASDAAVTNMFHWTTQYSGLNNVAYGNNGATAEIYLKPEAGYSLTLTSFQLGAWPNTDRTSQVTLLGGDGSVLASTGNITISGLSPTSFAVGQTRTDGFRIQFGPDGFNVGIDNITFSWTKLDGGGGGGGGNNNVPAPASLALLGLAFAGLGWTRRRARA